MQPQGQQATWRLEEQPLLRWDLREGTITSFLGSKAPGSPQKTPRHVVTHPPGGTEAAVETNTHSGGESGSGPLREGPHRAERGHSGPDPLAQPGACCRVGPPASDTESVTSGRPGLGHRAESGRDHS